MKTVVFTFGRFQPVTRGHKVLFDTVRHVASGMNCEHFVFTGHTHDNKRNPLKYHRKLYYLNHAFPEVNFVESDAIKSPFDALRKFSDIGVEKVIMVTGSDRFETFDLLIPKYMNHSDPAKKLNFKEYAVIVAGGVRPVIELYSGTDMRDAAIEGNRLMFYDGLPTTMNLAFAYDLYKEVRSGLLKV